MFTKPTLKAFRKDFAQAVAELEAQYKVKIELGGIRYDQSTFTSKMTVVSSENGETPAEINWKKYAPMAGLDVSLFGQWVTLGGKRYQIAGWIPSKRKYPVLIKSEAGTEQIATIQSIKNAA